MYKQNYYKFKTLLNNFILQGVIHSIDKFFQMYLSYYLLIIFCSFCCHNGLVCIIYTTISYQYYIDSSKKISKQCIVVNYNYKQNEM